MRTPAPRPLLRYLLLLIWAVVAACGDEAPAPEAGVSIRALPVAEATPEGFVCAESVAGGGLNRPGGAGEEQGAGAVRLSVAASGETLYDKTLAVGGATSTLDFPAVPSDRALELAVSVCLAPEGQARWSAQARVEALSEGERREVPVLLLPVGAFACPGASGEDASRFPDEALAFAAVAEAPDGGGALLLGGVNGWTTQTGVAPASDQVWRYDNARRAFERSSLRLPQGRAMGAAMWVSPAPSEAPRILLLGGLTAVAEAGLDPAVTNVLAFGPEAGAQVPPPLWVDVEGGAVEELGESTSRPAHLREAFFAGAGFTETGDGAVVAVAGGVRRVGQEADLSRSLTLLRLGASGVRYESLEMATARVAPAVVSVSPGVVAIIGGNIDTGSGLDALTRLVEVFDVSGATSQPMPLVIASSGSADAQELARPTAFPHVVEDASGHLVVVGGLTVFSSKRVGQVPTTPSLYRISLTASGGSAELALTSPPSYRTVQELSLRGFAATVRATTDSVWLVGGIAGGDNTTPFRPRRDVLQINLRDGSVSEGPASMPLFTVGGMGARMWDGVAVVLGGVVEPQEGLLDVTNAALLYEGNTARLPCGPLEP